MDNLSDDEKRALIRDRVMQQFVQQSHYDPMADAFDAGWDAAMEYKEQASDKIGEKLDGDDSRHE
jgi:hypothetical protein